MAVITNAELAAIRQTKRQTYRDTFAVWRSPAAVGGKVGVPVEHSTGNKGTIYDAAGMPNNPELVRLLGIAGGRDDDVLFCSNLVDLKRGDEVRTATKRYTVHTTATTRTQHVAVLTELPA